jgi:hypothetical protein
MMNRECVVSSAVTAGLAGLLLATAVNNVPDHRFDRLVGLGRWRVPTPNWRFFGPNPGVSDDHLLYRDITDGEPGQWAEIEMAAERPWYGLAWNPKNRPPKVLFDAISMIARAASHFAGDMTRIPRTAGYRFLECYIRDYVPHDPRAADTQFMLLRSHPDGTAEKRRVNPVFASEYVPLAAATAAQRAPVSADEMLRGGTR